MSPSMILQGKWMLTFTFAVLAGNVVLEQSDLVMEIKLLA